MRFYARAALDNSLNRFDFDSRNRGWLATTRHKAINSWCGKDLKPPLNAPFEKYITGKQGQHEDFGPVFPIVCGCVKRKKSAKSLVS